MTAHDIEMLPVKRIKFQRASCSTTSDSSSHQVRALKLKGCSVSGKEVQEFYEQVLSHPASTQKKSTKREKGGNLRTGVDVKSIVSHDLRRSRNTGGKNLLLKLAQDGDIKEIKNMFRDKKCLCIDAEDRYKWTALMCAACAGHSEVVSYLLEKGANKNLVNDKGQTAYDLARKKKFTKVLRIFHSWETVSTRGVNTESITKGEAVRRRLNKTFFCIACDRSFNSTTEAQHRTSTVHLFNTNPKQRGTWYHINESNKGYQMLVRDGWDTEKGLGPAGKEGTKFPIKTILKRDRKCLGSAKCEASVPRVTHFKAYDINAVKKPRIEAKRKESKMKESTINKRQLAKQKMKEKAWEVDFRTSFSLE